MLHQVPVRCRRTLFIGLAQAAWVNAFNLESWQRVGRNMGCSDLDNQSSRWRSTDGSYADTGEVGFGGGVEVTMTRAFCIEMLRVLDWVSTCDELLVAVRQSARLWSDYHPAIYFSVDHGLPRQGEVVLRAERQGTHKKALATASHTSDGRFEIVFNTDKCFTSLSLLEKSDDLPDVSVRYMERCAAAEKFNFEVTLAHELGHVLGLGHPGSKGFFLSSEGSQIKSAHEFIPIVAEDVCSGLKVHHQAVDCHDITDSTTCKSNPACAWNGRISRYDHRSMKTQVWCANILNDALMGAHHAWSKGFINPAENDLAGLFFLYPSNHRMQAWGTKPIPLMSMTLQKLKFLAQEHLGNNHKSSTLLEDEGFSKRELAEIVAKERPWHYIHLPKVEDTAGYSNDNSQSPHLVSVCIATILLFGVACSSVLARLKLQTCTWDPENDCRDDACSTFSTSMKSQTCTLDPENWLRDERTAAVPSAVHLSYQPRRLLHLDIHSCLRCGSLGDSMKRCSACHRACYCSQKCQREDWSNHKTRCQTQQTTRIALDGIYHRVTPKRAERTHDLDKCVTRCQVQQATWTALDGICHSVAPKTIERTHDLDQFMTSCQNQQATRAVLDGIWRKVASKKAACTHDLDQAVLPVLLSRTVSRSKPSPAATAFSRSKSSPEIR